MLYSEFVTGTGCKDNATNYRIYKDIEVMYMNSDLSKAEIYEYGKKLVDNSKSEAEIEAENKITAEIDELKADNAERKNRIESRKSEIEREKAYLVGETDKGWIDYSKNNIKWYKEDIRQQREWIRANSAKIKALKALLG